METEFRDQTEPTLAQLVGGIVNDTQTLVQQELALARREVADELRKTRDAAISFGIAGGGAAVGGILLALMLVHLLHWVSADALPLWACYGVIGVLLIGLGAALFLLGRHKAASIHLVPQRTVETMKENFEWIKSRK
jgi:hypothetical protein